MITKGWRDLLHDARCAGVQIDLIGRAPSGTLTIIEVKMRTAGDFADVSRAQRVRLGRAAALLAEVEPVQVVVAFVAGRNLRLLPVDALTPF